MSLTFTTPIDIVARDVDQSSVKKLKSTMESHIYRDADGKHNYRSFRWRMIDCETASIPFAMTPSALGQLAGKLGADITVASFSSLPLFKGLRHMEKGSVLMLGGAVRKKSNDIHSDLLLIPSTGLRGCLLP